MEIGHRLKIGFLLRGDIVALYVSFLIMLVLRYGENLFGATANIIFGRSPWFLYHGSHFLHRRPL